MNRRFALPPLLAFGILAAMASPSFGTSSGSLVTGSPGDLDGLSVVSPTSVWAVGDGGTSGSRTLVLHWNGSNWSRVVVPSPGASAGLNAVDSDWAVGAYKPSLGGHSRPLTLHRVGSTWSEVPCPSPGDGNAGLMSVSGPWAVGSYGTGSRTLILHWTDGRWTRVASPDPGSTNVLSGVSGSWAVGFYQNGSQRSARSLFLHWSGTAWRQVAIPNLDTASSPQLSASFGWSEMFPLRAHPLRERSSSAMRAAGGNRSRVRTPIKPILPGAPAPAGSSEATGLIRAPNTRWRSIGMVPSGSRCRALIPTRNLFSGPSTAIG